MLKLQLHSHQVFFRNFCFVLLFRISCIFTRIVFCWYFSKEM